MLLCSGVENKLGEGGWRGLPFAAICALIHWYNESGGWGRIFDKVSYICLTCCGRFSVLYLFSIFKTHII